MRLYAVVGEDGPTENVLTTAPVYRWRPGCTVWEAVGFGSAGQRSDSDFVFSAAQLKRRLDDAELAALGIYLSGTHECRGVGIAAGNAHVIATRGAELTVYESASAIALDGAYVTARGHSRVNARGGSFVGAYDESFVDSWESAHVDAFGLAVIRAWGGTVNAFDRARVVALNDTVVQAWGESEVMRFRDAQVTAHDNARVASGHVSNDDTAIAPETQVTDRIRPPSVHERETTPILVTDRMFVIDDLQEVA